MKKQSFTKPFLNIDEQIEKLKSIGIQFKNENQARYLLENINFYRLSGYWFIFKNNDKFQSNIYFEDIINLYNFDRELRLHMLNAIERIEISIRARFIDEFTKKYGIYSYLNSDLFYNTSRHTSLLQKLKEEFGRSKEQFSKHFKNNYKEELPPLWISAELITLGQISNWLNNIKIRQDRQNIAKYYKLDEKILFSFLHHLTVIRNTSAHHSRLWNKKISILFTYPKVLNEKINLSSRQNIYNTIVMCEYLMNVIDKDNNWKLKLDDLIVKYNIDTKLMGYKG